MSNVFLGKPNAKVVKWCEDHYGQKTFEINDIVDTTKTVTTTYGTNQPNRIATDGVNTIVVPCVATANGSCCFQVSEDGGQTFTALTDLFPPATSDVRVACYDQLTNSFIVASSGSDYNIYRLKKETSGWTKTTLKTGTDSFYGVSVCGSKILAVGKSKQIYLSQDSGSTWTNIYNTTLDEGLTDFYGCCITDSILIVTVKGKSSSQKAIYWSEDNGTTWHASAMYEKDGTTLCKGYSCSSGIRSVEKVGNKFTLSFMDMYNPNSTAKDDEKNTVPFISDDGKTWKKANINLKFVWSEDAKQYVPTKYTCPMQCVKVNNKNVYVQLDSSDMSITTTSTDGFAGYFYVSQDECETFESKQWKDLNTNHATVLRPRSVAVIGTKLVGFDYTDSFSKVFKVFNVIK